MNLDKRFILLESVKSKEAPGVVIDPSVTKTRMYLLVVILNKLPFSFMNCIYFPFLCFLFILPVFGLLCVLCYGTVSVSFSFLNAMHGRHSAVNFFLNNGRQKGIQNFPLMQIAVYMLMFVILRLLRHEYRLWYKAGNC